MKYEISMIMPVYNGEKFIENAMNSIINQTFGFKNIEVIIIDDNSTDNTKNIIKEYSIKYKNCKCIFLKNNSGTPGKSRNIGMKNASGKYIMFIDQDDIYEQNACEIAYNKIIEYNTPVIFYNFNDIDISSNLKTQCWYNFKKDLIINPTTKNQKKRTIQN